MTIGWRSLLKISGIAALGASASHIGPALAQGPAADATKADYTIQIAHGLVELAPDQIISTTLYNGQFPGPLLRLREGQPVTIDIHNATGHPEQLHWHGQKIPSDVDGAEEEGTPNIPPSGSVREVFMPGRAASASTIRMSGPAATSTAANIPARWGRSISSRRTIPATTIRKSSWCSKSSDPPSAATTWTWVSSPARRPRRSRTRAKRP